MATQVYLIMYVLMFVAARNPAAQAARASSWLQRPRARPAVSSSGALPSAAAFVIGFVPPSQFGRSNPLIYGTLLLGGVLLIGVVPPVLLFRLRKPSWKGGHVVAPAGMAFGDAPRRRHRLITRRTGAILVVLALVGVVIYKHGRDDPLARARADRVLSRSLLTTCLSRSTGER